MATRIWTNEKIVKMLTGSPEERKEVLITYFANRRRYYRTDRHKTDARMWDLVRYMISCPEGEKAWESLTPANQRFLNQCTESPREDLYRGLSQYFLLA